MKPFSQLPKNTGVAAAGESPAEVWRRQESARSKATAKGRAQGTQSGSWAAPGAALSTRDNLRLLYQRHRCNSRTINCIHLKQINGWVLTHSKTEHVDHPCASYRDSLIPHSHRVVVTLILRRGNGAGPCTPSPRPGPAEQEEAGSGWGCPRPPHSGDTFLSREVQARADTGMHGRHLQRR